MSHLDAGLTPINNENHVIGDLLKAAIAPFKIHAEEKDIALIVNCPKPSFEIIADRALIELALSNLIDNALKLTPRGGQVKVGASQAGDIVRLWVRDTGAGIDTSDLPHSFESFYRGRKATV